MAKGFTLETYPWAYTAQFNEDKKWIEEYIENPHKTPAEEAALSPEESALLLQQRNSFPKLPLVNYTSQYGMGCFEGLKAYPQKDGSLKLFRPDENAARMKKSMEGLMMPGFPEEMFLEAVITMVRKNRDCGFFPAYDAAWEADNYVSGHSVYLRPFSYSEPAIGLGVSMHPWVIIIATPVGAYFAPGNAKAVVTDKARATPNGTGWIKCNANYVIPILAKKQAMSEGYMEAIFLDSVEHKYVEEGSSCNIFFKMKNGSLITPELGDTILPGINRKSVIELARDMGIIVEERKVPIAEVMEDAVECFVTGTAAGISYIESITQNGKTAVFNGGKPGELTTELLKTLKNIQYGASEDTRSWMVEI
ncbi:MAG: branched-chain-amino-acid transaminase [Spirochaetales bacterium]|uniref:Branched-chain-amino-acid aminotransferase n=1 Tax=Candidatus Thalassospirochaeta sargassi TaxID=3119039 RepID=A0AAJ1MJ81_9SPIO|nr:branched-chain-amino-acid transaminase [Spirochaetales bacterium]